MIVGTKGSVIGLLLWQWRNVVLSGVLASAVAVAHEIGGQTWIELPTLPLVVVGAALGIFVSFRTNSAYDRWWEARKLWGSLVNSSRHFAIESIRYLPQSDRSLAQKLVRRQIAYVHTLRCWLRREDPYEDEIAAPYLKDEPDGLETRSSVTTGLLDLHMADLDQANRDGKIDDRRLQSFDETVRAFLNIQGGCERIRNTPLPRPYSFISERMIQWFGALMPCGLVADLSWFVIPISILVVMGFKLISETGRVLEDPFTTTYNGMPMSSLSRTIEINLLELLGETELPTPHEQKPRGVLM